MVVVVVVVGIFFAFGLNFSNLDFSFSTALCAKILLSLSLLPLLFFNRGLNRGFSVSVSSFSSFVNFWPFRSLNKSAKERGLNVVVVDVFAQAMPRFVAYFCSVTGPIASWMNSLPANRSPTRLQARF